MNQDTASPSYSRQTIICATDLLKALGHSGFERFLLELELSDPGAGQGNGLMARATSLANFAIKNPTALSPERRTIAYEIILRAIQIWKEGVTTNLLSNEREKFSAALAREGLSSLLQETELPIEAYSLTDDWKHEIDRIIPGTNSNVRGSNKPMQNRPIGSGDGNQRKIFIVHGHESSIRT